MRDLRRVWGAVAVTVLVSCSPFDAGRDKPERDGAVYYVRDGQLYFGVMTNCWSRPPVGHLFRFIDVVIEGNEAWHAELIAADSSALPAVPFEEGVIAGGAYRGTVVDRQLFDLIRSETFEDVVGVGTVALNNKEQGGSVGLRNRSRMDGTVLQIFGDLVPIETLDCPPVD